MSLSIPPPGQKPPSPSAMGGQTLNLAGPRVAQALVRDKEVLNQAFGRLVRQAEARAGQIKGDTPAFSLEYVLNNPEKFRDKELGIAWFDQDGTIIRGQAWIKAGLDALRYGPKNSMGVGSGRFLFNLVRGIFLRIGEKLKGKADAKKTDRAIGSFLKGLDKEKSQRALDRYYEIHGKRGLSQYILEELAYHRAEGNLVIWSSASPRHLVQRLAVDLGIPAENAFGTEIEFGPNGKATGKYLKLREEKKVESFEEHIAGKLREKGIPFKIVAAYSDSDSDLPMFEYTKNQGGIVIAVNPPREEFEKKVLGMNGIVVHEEPGHWDEGERKTTYFSSEEGGRLVHKIRTPSIGTPPIVKDLKEYGTHMVVQGGSLALSSLASKAVLSATEGVNLWEMADLSQAVAGGLTAGATHFFTPKDGRVPWLRRFILGDLAPLASALYFASGEDRISPTALFAAALSSRIFFGTVKLIGHGFGMPKLERYAEGKVVGALSRTIQLFVYRALYPILRPIEQRYLGR